jgi:hypothetical protein
VPIAQSETSMPRLAAPALLIACLVLILAACGGSATTAVPGTATDAPAQTAAAEEPSAAPDAPVAGTDLNACEIVTAEEVATAAGLAVADVSAGSVEDSPTVLSPGRTECTYEWDGGGVIVELTPDDGENMYDAARGSYADASDVSNHGGDGAFFSQENRRAFFWKGAVTVMLTLFLADDEMRPFAEEIGKGAIAKV